MNDIHESKIEELRELISKAIQEVFSDPQFDYDIENVTTDSMIVNRIAEKVYPVTDIDFFRKYRYALLKNELALIESQWDVKERES